MVDISKYSDQNWKEIDGVHYNDETSDLSYPEEGNDLYLAIEDNSYWFRHRNRVISEKVTSMISEKVFLDIGGGNGYVARGLEKEGVETILIEPGRTGALNASRRGLNKVLCTTLDGAAIRKGTIPAAGIFDVLEHVEDDFGFLRKIWSLLREDGLLAITVPAFNILWSEEDIYAGHFRRYNMSKLVDLATKVGFKVEYSSYLFSFLPPLIYLIRVLPFKLRLRKSYDHAKSASRDHAEGRGLVRRIINSLLHWEFNRIASGRKMPFGSSCFIVLKKIEKPKDERI